MHFGRTLAGVALVGAVIGLPMCGSEDSKKKVTAEGGEAGAESPSAGGSDAPSPQGGSGGVPSTEPAGGVGGEPGSAGTPPSVAGQPGGGESGQPGVAGPAGEVGAGGTPAFCAVDETSCCGPEEPTCDTWPGTCGQSMNPFSCCEAGQRRTCEVQFFDGNYQVIHGREACECGSGSCNCACVKGDVCQDNETDCNNTSWSDLCVLGNSPTCCDSANGIRQKCVFNGVKSFTSSPIIDECTGEGFGTADCSTCLNGEDPACDEDFFNSCSDAVSYCSDSTIGYRMSCLDGASLVECTCDPSQ